LRVKEYRFWFFPLTLHIVPFF
jgi:hypothetical protein